MVAAAFKLINSKSLRPLTVTVTKTLILSLFLIIWIFEDLLIVVRREARVASFYTVSAKHRWSNRFLTGKFLPTSILQSALLLVRRWRETGSLPTMKWVSKQSSRQVADAAGEVLPVWLSIVVSSHTHARTARRLSSDSRDRGADNHLTTINHESTP